MTVGGGVLSPRAGAHVIRTTSRLVVGLRLHGTIAALHPRSGSEIKCRPFLRYFAETLRRLRCDVTLFAPVDPGAGAEQLSRLREHEFPCGYRVVCDPTSGAVGNIGRGRKRNGAARANFQDCLSDVAAELRTSPSRILFVDSEINYRFSPAQTIVVEAFRPQRVRQHQRRQRGEHPDALQEQRQHAAVLESEFAWTQGQRCAPFSPGALDGDSAPRAGENSLRTAALAINREDCTLVALAGMVVELAAADVAVADYLRVEPLVEKLTVPFHGDVNYLPMENCDDMEQWDWDAVEVREARRREEEAAGDVVPETEEREEHRGMFK